jgi:hypothetical protein
MAGIVERSQSLKRESLSELLVVIDKKSTPFLSQVKKGFSTQKFTFRVGC